MCCHGVGCRLAPESKVLIGMLSLAVLRCGGPCPQTLGFLGRPVACLRGGLYSQLKGHWKNRPEDFWKRHCQLALRSRPVQGRAPDRCWGVAGNTPRHLSSLSEGAAGAAHRLSGPQEGAPLPNGGPIWTTEGRSHLALRLRRVPKEDWVLVFISLGWSCAFAGAVAFKAW